MKSLLLPFVALFVTVQMASSLEDTFSTEEEGTVPQSFEALWNGYDPRAEPLDVEVLKEWEEDGVLLKVLRYRVGVFKGQKSLLAAVYGYPKNGTNLPGLVQAHGGGQYANSNAVLMNAKRGYATISISWAGRIQAPDYKVSPSEVKLFFEGKTDHPDYKLTTDWGALDGYHAPFRHEGGDSMGVGPSDWTIDSVDSPRNVPYFLWTLAARRALTFLEQQDVVDAERLGVYGHSMGGKITVLTAGSDSRVKAAAPSCGGISNTTDDDLYQRTLADAQYLQRITCPIMFLSPSNDFHGRIDDLQKAFSLIKSEEWRATCAPHHNHQDTGIYEVATQLWFDEHLKERFETPETPRTRLRMNAANGVPTFIVQPDEKRTPLYVDIYYTRHGKKVSTKKDRDNTVSRFWHHVPAVERNGRWVGQLPLYELDKPLWVYANVVYALDESVAGAGYYYRDYEVETFNLSSRMAMVWPDQLKDKETEESLHASLLIEDFEGDWEKEWFSYRPEEMPRKTHKVYDARYAAPAGAKLVLDVKSVKQNKLVVGIDGYACEVKLFGGPLWQIVELSARDFKDVHGTSLENWDGIMELRIGDKETLRDRKKNAMQEFGKKWNGERPQFRNLRWIVE